MRIRRNGIYYLDAAEINFLSKNDKGKIQLKKMGDYQQITWFIKNSEEGANRAKRRQKINPGFGFMKNNTQDRTRKKLF